MTKVAVIGLGYIGLPTSIILAKNGFDVLGVDISSEVIETLKLGKAHIVEPGLEKSLSQNKIVLSISKQYLCFLIYQAL